MTFTMLMLIGGCLMMLEPLTRRRVVTPNAPAVIPLRDAFVPIREPDAALDELIDTIH